MKNLHMSKRYLVLLSSMLFGSPVAIVADTADQAVVENKVESYIRFDSGEISSIIFELSNIDQDGQSPIHLLRQHLENGFLLGLRDEVIGVLEYAEWFVSQMEESDAQRSIAAKLDRVIEDTLKGDFDITQDGIMRSHHLRLLFVNERMTVQGKTIFKSNVVIKKKLRVHGDARFYDDVDFRDNVAFNGDVAFNNDVVFNSGVTFNNGINGTLSVQDEVIGCDLTVGCNINLPDSTDIAHGNIVKAGTTFIHNFGTDNTFVGKNAGNFNTSGEDNTGIGVNALQSALAGTNTAVGFNALGSTSTGTQNTAVGTGALAANSTGSFNVAVGDGALTLNTTGYDNVGIGLNALGSNTTGNENMAMGTHALFLNAVGSDNIAIGHQSLFNNTDNNNIAIGGLALTTKTSGAANTVVGTTAMTAATSGDFNVVVGANAGLAMTSGTANTFVGYQVGSSLTSGDNNIYLGNQAGDSIVSESNTIRIGNASTATAFMHGIVGVVVGGTGVPVVVDANNQLGTVVSSKRFKNSIKNMGTDSERIYNLNAVSFAYKQDSAQTKQYGLIAEDVAEVFPELVVREQDGTPFTIRYEVLPVLLLNEVQKLEQRIDSMEQALTRVKAQLQEFTSR